MNTVGEFKIQRVYELFYQLGSPNLQPLAITNGIGQQ